MSSLEGKLEQLQNKIDGLENQLKEKEKSIAFLEDLVVQSVQNEEMIENENLMLDCENQFLFEQNQEYLNSSLYQEIWEENQRLQQQIVSLNLPILLPHLIGGVPFYPFPLSPANASEAGTASLAHENEYLKNRILEMERSSVLKEGPSYSSKTIIDSTKRRSFIRSVLELSSKGLDCPFALQPLHGRIVEEDSGKYFRQFLPYILEEVRASMCAQKNIIEKKNRVPFQINLKEDFDETWSENSDMDENGEIQLLFWTYQSYLPKLEHGFFNEAVLVIIPLTEEDLRKKNRSCGRKFENSKETETFLAIATRRTNYDDDDDDTKRKRVDISITLPRQDYPRLLQLLDQQSDKLWLHWLCGLTPAERMYEICITMPGVDFQQQFIEAELLPWPSAVSKADAKNAPSELIRLNDIQRDIVERLQQAPPGLRLLVGPPGTGKTTTAISWLINYAGQHPDHRILISAPSNQAVRVLLTEAMRFLPTTSLALTGIAKNLPDSFLDVYVHGYASSLFKPLIYYKKQLEQRNPLNILALINKSLGAIKEKINNIVDTPTRMRVKSNVTEGMRRFKVDLISKINSFCQSHQTPTLTGVNGSNWRKAENSNDDTVKELEDIVVLIQKNGFYLESFMLQRSQIIFSTLISAGRKWLRKQIDEFSMVLVDEAAQALVPEALIPLYYKPSLYLQIGDPSQLPATIKSQAARNKGYENSMMHWLIKEYKQPHEMLTIQYRMDEEICRWISQQYYENKLKTASAVIKRRSILKANNSLSSLFQHPSLFFNIKGEENRRSGSELTASCSNKIEATAVIDMIYYLIFKCGFQSSQIGVITFYADQVAVLNNALQNAITDKGRVKELEIKTVDGFQGGEKDIILISVVRTSESVGFLDDWRRLNVAMSRPRFARWIFGKLDSLNCSNSDFPSLLSEHREPNRIISEEHFREHAK
jgi:hypothetical protein